jgi:hypothetical protein
MMQEGWRSVQMYGAGAVTPKATKELVKHPAASLGFMVSSGGNGSLLVLTR